MGLFFIFKLIVFTASFFKATSAAVLGHRAPCPGTDSWSLPGRHEEQLAEGLPSLTAHQDTPAANIPCVPGLPPLSALTLLRPRGARAHAKLKPFEEEPLPHISFTPRLGQEPPHTGYSHAWPGGESSFREGGCSLETCFSWKTGEAHKGRLGNQHKGFFPAPGYAGSTGGCMVL